MNEEQKQRRELTDDEKERIAIETMDIKPDAKAQAEYDRRVKELEERDGRK